MTHTAGYHAVLSEDPRPWGGGWGPGAQRAVDKFHFLSLGSLTDGRLSVQICPGLVRRPRLPEQPGKPAPITVAQMASPNDKVNSNMSWRHCQPAAYLSCHSSLLVQGHPPSWSCSLPWVRIIYRKVLISGLGGGHRDRGFPEHTLVIFCHVSEANTNNNTST